MSDYSPPGGNTPPPETAAERAEREQQEARLLREKLQTIAVVPTFLNPFAARHALVALLVNIIQGDGRLDKRYFIAVAINNLMVGREIENADVQDRLAGVFARQARDPKSDLYQALNYQKNFLFPISFGGPMKPIAWNYAHSLQRVHKVIKDEEARVAANRR